MGALKGEMMNELQTMETEIVGQRALFDYAALDAETRIVVQQRAGEIKSIAKRMAADVVEIGEKLADVKQRLGANDRFNDWLSAELGWSPRTAHNFIGVWRRFGSANFAIENVAVSALYALAAPSTPVEAVEEVKRIADRGQEVTNTVAKEIIEKAKATRPKQAELVEAVDPSTICLCGCKAGDHVRNGRYLECTNCECEIFQEASAEEIVERNTVEKALGITPSKRTASGPAFTPTPETIARLKAEMELEESDDREKASGEPSTEFFARPAGWFNSPIEIRITLLPGGDAETRKIQYAVRDAAIQFRAAPLTAEDYGEETLLRLLPDAAYKLVEQLAAEWGKNQWSDAAKKRLKAEAIARWRREPVETGNLDDEEYDEGSHPGFPPGFDANRAEKGLAQTDEPETLRNLLALVIEDEIPIEAIRRWTDEQKRQAREWASAANLRASDHEVEVPARPEILQACICGELGYEHAGGVCMLDGCDCQQWRPANYAQCPRCKGEIVTLANPKDFDGLCFNCQIAEEDARRSFPQEEINRIARFNAAGMLGEGKPIKICMVLDNPYVITGSVGSGDTKNYQRVWAYPIRPLSEVGEENARNYQDAYAEYSDRLQRSISDDSVSYQPLSYQNVKINCGTKKKPDWWVIVGEQVEFTVDYCAGYPDDEIEATLDDEQEDYQARWEASLSYEERERYDNAPCSCGHCREWHDGAGGCCMGCLRGGCDQFHCAACDTKGGHKASCEHYVLGEGTPVRNDDVDLPQPQEPTLERALHRALHSFEDAAKRWKPLQENGATDDELKEALGREFGDGGSSCFGGHRQKGGKNPQFTWLAGGDESKQQTLKGKRLLAKVREVLEIGAPRQVENAVADDDDFTAPRCSECGRIDGAHTTECSQNPNTLTFEDYLAYAEFTTPKAPRSWARKWMLSREMDGSAHAWKLYWKELEDSGVIPFLQLCMCGHPLLKHKCRCQTSSERMGDIIAISCQL